MPATIKFVDNQPETVTFKYSNFTRKTSMHGQGFYYAFDCEEGKINANEYLARALAQNWPGREGMASITKRNAQSWEITVLEEGQPYPLEMREWNDESREFVAVDSGFDHVPDSPEPKKGPQAPETPAKAQGAPAWGELVHTMKHAVEAAQGLVGDSMGPAEVERIAVTLYLDARKARIPAMEIGPLGATPLEQVKEAINGEEVPPAEVVAGDTPPKKDDLPDFEKDPDLPF